MLDAIAKDLKTVDPAALHTLRFDEQLFTRFGDAFSGLAVNLVIAVIILAVTFWAAGWISALVRRAIGRLHRAAPDPTLQNFAGSLARYLVIIVGLIAVLQQLGVQTTSILAVLGAASLAIGLALQGALSNVAAGVMLLILRPYRIGDFVEVNGRTGTIKALDLFTTTLSDPDNLKVVVPNGKAFGDVIVNYTEIGYRRMELKFGIDYQDDIQVALDILLSCARSDPRVRTDPEPWANLTALGDSAVAVTLRAWADLDVYWDVRFDMIRRVKLAFDAAGLSIPYPHQVQINPPERPTAAPRAKATPSDLAGLIPPPRIPDPPTPAPAKRAAPSNRIAAAAGKLAAKVSRRKPRSDPR